MIKLDQKDIIICGNDKQIFAYEDDKIIKTVLPNIKKHKSKTREIYREFKECRPKNEKDEVHLQKIFSLVQTNFGIGEICQKEVDENFKLAKTLEYLILNGQMDEEKYKKLHRFLAWFTQSKVLINSLHAKNIVYSFRNNAYEFRLIDGFGDKTYIQFSKILNIFRQKNKMKCLRRLHKNINDLQIFKL